MSFVSDGSPPKPLKCPTALWAITRRKYFFYQKKVVFFFKLILILTYLYLWTLVVGVLQKIAN